MQILIITICGAFEITRIQKLKEFVTQTIIKTGDIAF